MKLLRLLYAIALLAMPLSYALKDIFAWNLVWVNPTLILGAAVYLLSGAPVRERTTLWLVVFAFVSASIGLLLMKPSMDRESSALYVGYVESMRLMLNVIWFWVSIWFLKLDKRFVLRWLAICVAWEFFVACYFELAMYDLAPVPTTVKLYLTLYSSRQTAILGSLPRMAGTFIESPPFGLFMFSCFVIFVLALLDSDCREDKVLKAWASLGAIFAFLGSVGSLSDQVIIALATMGLIFVLLKTHQSTAARRLLLLIPLIGLVTYMIDIVSTKRASESYYSGDPTGTGIGERLFHTRYGLGLLVEQPAAILVGIGPGRYGDYAVRTGYFRSTVELQVTPVAWIVEYGILGLFLIGRWLHRVGSRASISYGILGVGALIALLFANMFQANWLSEAWFLALAFLYTSGRTEVPEKTRDEGRPPFPGSAAVTSVGVTT